MLDFEEPGGLIENPSDDNYDHCKSSSSSENPLLFGRISSSRLIVDEKYSDTPKLTTSSSSDNSNSSSKISFNNFLSLEKSSSSGKENHGGSPDESGDTQRNIEFTAPKLIDDIDDDDDESTSPPLWKYARSNSSESNTTTANEAFPFKNRYNSFLSLQNTGTVSQRSQEIARGRQELMDMIRTMPENSYELSLKDIIEHKQQQQKPQVDDHQDVILERETSSNNSTTTTTTNSMVSSRDQMKNNENKVTILKRSKSIDSNNSNGPVLLKMFLPFSDFGLNNKKKRKNKGLKKVNYYAKVSPKPTPLMDGEKGSTTTTTVDKEWWKKRFSVAGDKNQTENNNNNRGFESRGGSSGSSNGSYGSRKMGAFLTCFRFFKTKKIKTLTLKRSDY